MLGLEDISVQIEEPFDILPLFQYCDEVIDSCDRLLEVAKSERITLSTSVGALRLDHYEAGHYDASLEKGHSGRERRREDKALAGNQQRQGTFW